MLADVSACACVCASVSRCVKKICKNLQSCSSLYCTQHASLLTLSASLLTTPCSLVHVLVQVPEPKERSAKQEKKRRKRSLTRLCFSVPLRAACVTCTLSDSQSERDSKGERTSDDVQHVCSVSAAHTHAHVLTPFPILNRHTVCTDQGTCVEIAGISFLFMCENVCLSLQTDIQTD